MNRVNNLAYKGRCKHNYNMIAVIKDLYLYLVNVSTILQGPGGSMS
jgi:hypothetical protein